MIKGHEPGRGAIPKRDRLKIKAEVERRTTKYVPIPGDFNPLKATADDLARYRLPPKPNEADKTLFKLWQNSLAQPVKFVPPELGFGSPISLNRLNTFRFSSGEGEGEVESGAPSLQLRETRIGRSCNWAGGVILARQGDRFIQMTADWSVPDVNADGAKEPLVCSTWIGLGGFRGWMTSMPQIGTAQSVGDTGGEDGSGATLPPYFAWCQWWLQGLDTLQFPITIDSVGIGPEDRVVCWITLLPPNYLGIGDHDWVLFYIRNLDTGIATSIAMAPPMDALGRPVPAQAASAEWILERPTAIEDSPNGNVHKGNLYPLPRFDHARADNFGATLAPRPVLAPAVPATGFRACRRLRLINRARSEGSAEVLVDALTLDDSSLQVDQR